MRLIDRWKQIVRDANSKGLPLPMARDPKTGLGSITMTMYWASFSMCLFAGLMFLVSAIAKWTGYFEPGDATQEAIKNASQYFFELYIASGSFYLGRKLQRSEKGAIDVEGKDDK